MAKRKPVVVADEVDEITELNPLTGKPRKGGLKDGGALPPEETLEDFVHQMFGGQEAASVPKVEGAMPSMAFLKEHFKTKSAIIRYLAQEGYKTKDIAKHLNVRYQHVRNVITTELKRGPNEDFSLKPGSATKDITGD